MANTYVNLFHPDIQNEGIPSSVTFTISSVTSRGGAGIIGRGIITNALFLGGLSEPLTSDEQNSGYTA